MKKQLILGMALSAMILNSCGPKVPQLGQATIDEVINAMTLEEKAHLVVGTGMAGFSGDSAVIGKTKKLVPGAAGTTYPIERLGIPAVVLADVLPDCVSTQPVKVTLPLITVHTSLSEHYWHLHGTRNW